jgi:hypothetical protein
MREEPARRAREFQVPTTLARLELACEKVLDICTRTVELLGFLGALRV